MTFWTAGLFVKLLVKNCRMSELPDPNASSIVPSPNIVITKNTPYKFPQALWDSPALSNLDPAVNMGGSSSQANL